MAGNGGWPLNVFLTPEKKPFFGGTYFPPKRAYNRSSWQEVLLGVSQAFKERRNEIEEQAENLTEHLVKSNSFGFNISEDDNIFQNKKLDEAFQVIMKSADRIWGGFGKAPKFPQSFVIQFLLRYHYVSGNQEALQQALLSLDKMIDGGIYDQAGGGFSRYSTDGEWLVPHFEKMLYDNALMISVLSEAYQLTQKEKYKDVIDEIIRFVERELLHVEGGFYSALDADSEGEEGKFYVWEYVEVKNLLRGDAEIFCKFYDITMEGNWEHKNILWKKSVEESFCKENNLSVDELKNILRSGKEKLMQKRRERIRPQLDDKILLSWNSLMVTALCKAFAATGIEKYKQLAVLNNQFLLKGFSKNVEGEFFHSWKNGKAKHPAFLDDYAFLIQSLIQLQEITGDSDFILKAKKLTDYVIKNFKEKDTGFFYYTSDTQTDILIRKKEVYDGAQPSGNSIMADNLYRLALYFDIPEWKESVIKTISSFQNAIIRYPSSFGAWACLFMEITDGTSEIVILNTDPKNLHINLLRRFIPHKVLMVSSESNDFFPLLARKKIQSSESIYLCRNYECQKPVATVEQLVALVKS
jgi:uncharacterized protein YyaL (SSP411 family)